MLMLMAGGSLVAGSDNPHFGTSMPLGPSTPSFLFRSAAQATYNVSHSTISRLGV
jgi:hypothetical protein